MPSTYQDLFSGKSLSRCLHKQRFNHFKIELFNYSVNKIELLSYSIEIFSFFFCTSNLLGFTIQQYKNKKF